MRTFQLNSKVKRGSAEVVVVHCGDYRFQGAFYEFLNRVLKLNENYDLMVIPGGPAGLALPTYQPQVSRSSWKWFRFFMEKHKIRRLILIQHQDCAWYQMIPLRLHASPKLRERQEQDLGRVAEKLKRDFPDLTVDLYYAGWDASDQVTIDVIPS